ncbi:cytochrome P450 [Streptomyces blastmyceticus]
MPKRTPLADIEAADVTIPKGAPLVLALASGSRDLLRFDDPDRFDITRPDNQHLGFGSGVHNCFGAPLARVVARTALNTLLGRLDDPRLVEDPPPYRYGAVLRGPPPPARRSVPPVTPGSGPAADTRRSLSRPKASPTPVTTTPGPAESARGPRTTSRSPNLVPYGRLSRRAAIVSGV